VVAVTKELEELLDELSGLTQNPERFNRRMVRVDELRSRIHRESRAYRIINAASQVAEFRRFSADRRIELSETTGAERAIRQIARDKEFILGVRTGATDVAEILRNSLARIEADLEGRGT
jgi:hypothetical protein